MSNQSSIRSQLSALKSISKMIDSFNNKRPQNIYIRREKFKVIPELATVVDALRSRLEMTPLPSHTPCPESNRLIFRSSTGKHIGPGTYYRNPCPIKKPKKMKTIPITKDLVVDFRSRSLEKCRHHNKQVEKVRDQKRKSFEELKEKQRSSFVNKHFRTEWKLRTEEIHRLKRSWGFVFTVLGLRTLVRNIAQNKLRRKKKARKLLKKFRGFTYIAVALRKWLTKTRQRIFCKAAVPVSIPIVSYLQTRQLRFRKLVFNTMRIAHNSKSLSRLMGCWKISIVKIQRNVRTFLALNQARRHSLKLRWLKITSKQDEDGKCTLQVDNQLHFINTKVIGPYTKNKFIRKYMKEVLSKYKIVMDKYLYMIKDVYKSFNRDFTYWQASAEMKAMNRDFTLQLPGKPRLKLFLNYELFKRHIAEANSFLSKKIK